MKCLAELVCDAKQPTGPNRICLRIKTARRKDEIVHRSHVRVFARAVKRYLLTAILHRLNPWTTELRRYDSRGFTRTPITTTQRGNNAFQPVRAFERLTVSDTLFPGQASSNKSSANCT
jgi:hypothetical protein